MPQPNVSLALFLAGHHRATAFASIRSAATALAPATAFRFQTSEDEAASTLYAAKGRLIPFNSNSPTGSTFTAFSTFISTRRADEDLAPARSFTIKQAPCSSALQGEGKQRWGMIVL